MRETINNALEEQYRKEGWRDLGYEPEWEVVKSCERFVNTEKEIQELIKHQIFLDNLWTAIPLNGRNNKKVMQRNRIFDESRKIIRIIREFREKKEYLEINPVRTEYDKHKN